MQFATSRCFAHEAQMVGTQRRVTFRRERGRPCDACAGCAVDSTGTRAAAGALQPPETAGLISGGTVPVA